MKGLLGVLQTMEPYRKLCDSLTQDQTPVLATGVVDVQQTHLLGGLVQDLKVPLMVVAENERKAQELYEDLKQFVPDALFYPSRDFLFYATDVHSRQIDNSRAAVVQHLLKEPAPVVVLPAEAFLDLRMSREAFASFLFTILEGDIIEPEELCRRLMTLGYQRADQVDGPGQFALRGSILDVYSPVEETAYRIDFWDTEIDTIRTMDAYSQRSLERVKRVEIFPVGELIYTKETLAQALQKMEQEYIRTKAALEKKGRTEEAEKFREKVGETLERLRQEGRLSFIDSFLGYFYAEQGNLLSYMPPETVVVFCEPNRIRESVERVLHQFRESMKSRMEKGYLLKKEGELLLDWPGALHAATGHRQILFSTIATATPDFSLKNLIPFTVRSVGSFQNQVALFYDEARALAKEGWKEVLLTPSANKGRRIVQEMMTEGLRAVYVEQLEQKELVGGEICVCKGQLSRGFQYPVEKLAVYSDAQIFDRKTGRRANRKRKNAKAINSFTDLKVGDYVVHQSHGIGIFRGLEQIVVDGVNKDYLKISYADGGSLFVPVNQLDAIQKYIGGQEHVKLNKLGGQDWNKAKAKVRAAVAILAEDLIELYAKRQAAVGFAYSKDNLWQREFEETFPYDETEDQLAAIDDVKRDMQSNKVMDRLICGDVGYGKTEVAIRAAFKAVQDGKQVAYLVPTTLLAQQHYQTFVDRMANYPVKVGLLSRFRTAKEQKATIEELKKGFVDIVIGTHRLLSKDVAFHDLGLVIVDEEQRFGVAHKEKLKRLKENLDVLTLTATPIPRTLHMSLAGIRDMSVLEEPPRERHPVQTYVMESDPEFIRDAIHRELGRGGQVYYLYNRVESMEKEAARIQALVPEAVVAYAHGQMTERELERIMKDFVEGEIDVLVCTTIIETGLDIANVNTMLIQDADRMGLSQLYQLRGRVGRSNRLAYCYLMYRKDKVLSEVSEKRLATIREFTEFGSGFKVAMRDLEIRGAGNLLGAQQHGHMDAVGYEMYCRLLDEAVKKLRGETVEQEFETMMDLNVDAYLPSFYIKNEEQKLELYKRIAAIETREEYEDLLEEIEDRYGMMPRAVSQLMEVVLLKARAHRLDLLSVVQKQSQIFMTFRPDARVSPQRILAAVQARPLRYQFTSGTNPCFVIKMNEKDGIDPLEYVKIALDELEETTSVAQ
ncbi:MAG TPA: transcription-repair coupling factor [Firmicutes bacterium]|nr:transcription-repair coupling factor [Bacillota bacterium]